MKTIDTQGKPCPMPLIMTKKALQEIPDEETLTILMDNETSVKNVHRFLEEHHMKVITTQQDNAFILTVHKTGVIPETVRAEEYCTLDSPDKPDYIIAFQKDTLGQGDDELGRLLIKGFINTLPDVDHKPRALLFLNSGIFLALKNSPVIESLLKLEEAGTKVLVCGTCLDYFNKKSDLGVGIISNMYDILSTMSNAGKVLYP